MFRLAQHHHHHLAGVVVLLLLICGGLQAAAQLTLLQSALPPLEADRVVVGQTFLASSTDPTSGSAGWALTSHGVAEKLFTVDKHDEIISQVADSVTKISMLDWQVRLKQGYFFSDGTEVTAEHVADCLTELNTLNPSAQSSLGNMTVTAADGILVNITSDLATHVMDSVLAEWAFPIYKKDDNGNFIFTGPFAIENFTEDEQMDLIPNTYYDADALDRPKVTIKKFPDGFVLADAVKNREVDIAMHLPVETLAELREVEGVRIKSFEVGYHYMMWYNLDTLADVRVRKAIDTAIDRNALSQALAGGTATRSMFPDYSPYYTDDSVMNGDATMAESLLDGAGWNLTEDGQRAKDGETLSVTLVAYPQRPDLVAMQPVIANSLRALGINVTTILTGDDWDETQQIIDDRTFDLLLWAQHTLPAGDPFWFLSSFFRSDGANNHANFQNETIDDLIGQVSVAEDHDERVARTAVAMQAIVDQVPVSNLVTPFWHVGLSERLANYEPWGSDYYVVRSDLTMPEAAVMNETTEGGSETDTSGSSSSGHRRHIIIFGHGGMLLFLVLALFM